MNLNLNQKRILIGVSAIIAGMLFYPPFHRVFSGGSKSAGYHWLFDAPRNSTADVGTLIVQWLGVLIVGGIVFFIFKDSEK